MVLFYIAVKWLFLRKNARLSFKSIYMAKKSSVFATCAKWFALVSVTGIGVALSVVLLVFSIVYYQLPPLDSLEDYRPKIPMQIYTADNVLIGEFGTERREFVSIADMPRSIRLAVLAAEDSDFYEHSGIKLTGIMRAALANLMTGRRGQGGSTITMQVARNFFLSNERSYTRKIYEVAMAFKIERQLSKDRILEVYMNQIFLGNRSYGFASAAKTYFGKQLSELSISECATLAGLPVAPATYNPFVNIRRATMRRNYVLSRMHQLGYIDDITYESQVAQPIVVKQQSTEQEKAKPKIADIHAEYVAELARYILFNKEIGKSASGEPVTLGENIYSQGLNVYTTIRSTDQQLASAVVRERLMEYDMRYGYRGCLGYVTLTENAEENKEAINKALSTVTKSDGYYPAVVLKMDKKGMLVRRADGQEITIAPARYEYFARNYIAKPGQKLAERFASGELRAGSVILIHRAPKSAEFMLAQLPRVESAFVAADFETGAVRALVGGFDFDISKYNHVISAKRQPGSSFKPFIYSAALDKGFTASTIINDAPITIDPSETGGRLWEPKNYEGTYDGPMTLATALKKSKNLVSIRVMQAIGPQYAQNYVTRFGFKKDNHPPFLTTALGAGTVTPWEMLRGYGIFANGGYMIEPYIIEKVTDAAGNVILEHPSVKAGTNAPRAIDARNAFIMHTLLRGVALEGTGRGASTALQRTDMGAKTGTTNNSVDAWFAGYVGNMVAICWIGYDQPYPLGNRETGGGLALPVWREYMKVAMKGVPFYERHQPNDVVEVDGTYYYADQVSDAVQTLGLGEKTKPVEMDEVQNILRDQLF